MPFTVWFHAKYIWNPWSMLFHLAKILLVVFAILFKIRSAYCVFYTSQLPSLYWVRFDRSIVVDKSWHWKCERWLHDWTSTHAIPNAKWLLAISRDYSASSQKTLQVERLWYSKRKILHGHLVQSWPFGGVQKLHRPDFKLFTTPPFSSWWFFLLNNAY